MKISRLSILVIMLVMIVMTAGCSSKPQVGSAVSSSSIVNTNYNWVSYNLTTNNPITGGTITSNARVEKSTSSYQGNPATLIKTTFESTDTSGMLSGSDVAEVYFDQNMKTILGGTRTSTLNGQTKTEPVSTYEDIPSGIDLNNTMFTYEGTQSVTVPLGTYSNADVYKESFKGGSVTLWIAPGIPVPIKDVATTQYETITTNLVSWG